MCQQEFILAGHRRSSITCSCAFSPKSCCGEIYSNPRDGIDDGVSCFIHIFQVLNFSASFSRLLYTGRKSRKKIVCIVTWLHDMSLTEKTYHQCLSKTSSFLLETYLNGYRNFLCLNSCHFKSEKAVSSAAEARRPRPVRNLGPPTIDCQASNKEPELSANGEPFHIKNVGMFGEL